MAIFPRADLETYSFSVHVAGDEILRGLDVLGRLQHLHRVGHWGALTESNIEQSFVERVFADVFGYRTLLSDKIASGSPELIPKLYVPLVDGRSFPDFSVGQFRVDQQQIAVSAELKGPLADLDAPQAGQSYGGRSAVQQAMIAAVAAHAEWCIVSNTDEVRLYRVPDLGAYESVRLVDVVSPAAFRRAYALLSRRSLLGERPTDRSPLTRFHTHVTRGESMLVPRRDGRVRLIQRVKPRLFDAEFPFARLSHALGSAVEKVPAINVLSGAFLRPRLEGDHLIMDRVENGEVWQRIAVVKSGLLVCSFSLPLDSVGAQPGQPIFLDPAQVLERLGVMVGFAWAFFGELTKEALVFEWSLEDLGSHVRTNDRLKWTKPAFHVGLTCQTGVERTAYPEVVWGHRDSEPKDQVTATLGEVVRELFFPFEGRDDEHPEKRLCRLEPTEAQIKEFATEAKLDFL